MKGSNNVNVNLGYGNGFQTVNVCDNNILNVLTPRNIQTNLTEENIIINALDNPIGADAIERIVKKDEKVVIITSDITRPVPSARILPFLLERLASAGVPKDNITIVFALGSHRPHTEDEMISLVGKQIYSDYRCMDSTPYDCVSLGFTQMGTPIEISRVVVEADRRICLGNIEYHYFAGYSGGAKAVMPGCSNGEAIRKNHSMMVRPGAQAAVIDGNPVRSDLEDAIGLCNIDFILNVILGENKKIIHAVAGDFIKAHREGCKALDVIYSSPIGQKADIVIASQGGAPKDINLYQLQKALDNAKNAVNENGIIILVGECTEGFGSDIFEEWMRNAKGPDDIINRIAENFVLGGHKAAAIAMVLKKADIYLVSGFNGHIVSSMFMRPFKTVLEAYRKALEVKGENSSVIVMPFAGSTLPVHEKG